MKKETLVCPRCQGKTILFSSDIFRTRYYCRKCKLFVSTMRWAKQPVTSVKREKSIARKRKQKRQPKKTKKRTRGAGKRLCVSCGREISRSDRYCPFCGALQS